MTDRDDDQALSLGDFYALCDGPHREFFSSVLYEWREAGLPWEWQERDIVLCAHSAGQTLQLFFLHAGAGSEPPSLTCDLTPVRVRLGDAEADSLLEQLRKARGLELRVQADVCRVPEPGNAAGTGKQAMRTVLRRLSMHLPNALAP